MRCRTSGSQVRKNSNPWHRLKSDTMENIKLIISAVRHFYGVGRLMCLSIDGLRIISNRKFPFPIGSELIILKCIVLIENI